MPNWCENDLSVSGDKESLAVFMKSISGDTEMDFTQLVPRPAEQEDNWFNWNCDNWGTKWAPNEIWISYETETESAMTFQSAWAPPTELFTAIAKLFPTLDFSLAYSEGGMAVCGATRWQEGELWNECHVSNYTADPRYEELVAKDNNGNTDDFYEELNALENTIRDECLTAVGR